MDKKQLKKDFNLAGDTSDPEVLEQLSTHESEEVRWAVAANSHTPVDVLQKYLEDQDSNVQRMAKERLGISSFPAHLVEQKPTIFMSSLSNISSMQITKVLGMIYATHSTVALGFDKQSDRLGRSTNMALLNLEEEAKKIGANAILGLNIAINSSQGASAAFMGSSEGVLVYGTAVKASLEQ